jgi:hypothetical protein
MTTARTLTDADVEAIAQRLAELVDLAKARPANASAKPLTISPTTQAAARAELERRGLRAPRRM